jgi:hypothetical protein
MCATLLAQIISQGVEEGVFNTPNPQAVSQLIIRSWDSLKGAGATTLQEQHDVTLLAPRIKQVLDFYIDSVERLLGTEEGAITRPTESYVQTFAEIHSKLNTLSSE